MDKEYPLAFCVKADVFGLQVSHELPDEFGVVTASKSSMNATKSNMSDALPGSMYSRGGRDHFSESVMKSM